jgi:thiol-disulfide isomerase/thioredoxin
MEEERTRRSRLWWSGVIGVCAVVAAMIAALCLLQQRSAEPSTVDVSVPGIADPSGRDPASEPEEPVVGYRVGNVAPSFSLSSLADESASLVDYRGRVVILDFWASWCVPCRLSMPSLEAMARELGEDVVLIGVSLDRTEADARSYVNTRGYTDLVALYGSLSEARGVATDYGVLGIPRTFVIDREGIVRFAGHPSRLSRNLVESLL